MPYNFSSFLHISLRIASITIPLVLSSFRQTPEKTFLHFVTAAPNVTLTVNTNNDVDDGTCDGTHCSLREAILYAASADTVEFSITGTITLTGQITIDKNLTISGPGVNQLAVSGNNGLRPFYVNTGITAAISDLTIQDGYKKVGLVVESITLVI